MENAVVLGAGGCDVVGFERDAVAFGTASGRAEVEMAPPGAMVVPEMVVGLGVGAAGGKVELVVGHGVDGVLVFIPPPAGVRGR